MLIWQIIIAILVFGLLVLVHELGHFATAKATGIRVNGFSIGLGPRLVGFKLGETDFSLRLLPVGGACIMEGEDEKSSDSRAFVNKPIWARFLVLISGSAMNFLLGFIVIFILFAPAKVLHTPRVDSIPAELGISNAGVMPGDEFKKINGERVYVSDNLTFLLQRYQGAPYTIELVRNGKKVVLEDVKLEPRIFEGEESPRYGFTLTTVQATFWGKLHHVWLSSLDYLRVIRMTLADLFTGVVGVGQLTGPVGITATLSDAAKASEFRFLWGLVSFISINLAFVNLLPLPALDGGRILFLIIELFMKLFGLKRLNPKYENYIHLGGLALFMLLMVYVTFNDIVRLVAK